MSPTQHDQAHMRRAVRLAMNGRGRVEPNPMVGCVIVKDGRVIGDGFHERFGGPHAEPSALAACTESPRGATAYVTLEPCCHTNKKTPPCAPRLIEAKLGRVVIGCLDPNEQVNGRGAAMLRQAGIAVDAPLLEPACRQLIAPFTARTTLGRPYVTLKWAQTADGKIAGPDGARLQISNERSIRLVHELRARSDAILVGINTVLSDDPMLTARGVEARRQCTRIVLDRRLRMPLASKLVQSARNELVVVAASQDAVRANPDTGRELARRGVVIREIDPAMPLQSVLRSVDSSIQNVLGQGKVGAYCTHLLVEPGPTLAATFFRENLADRVWVFRAPGRLDDPAAPGAAPVPPDFIITAEIPLDGDVLTEYLNPRSPVFSAAEPSADLILAQS